MFAYPRCQIASAFHVEQNLAARFSRQDVGCKQHQLPIRKYDLAVARDNTEAVTVTVESQADFCVTFAQSFDEVDQVGWLGRVRMVVWKGAVHFAEQFFHVTSEPFVQFRREGTGNAVSAINGNAHRAGEFYVRRDSVEICFCDFALGNCSASAAKVGFFDTGTQTADLVSG